MSTIAKKIKCTCSGFVLQYEGGCQCDSGKGIKLVQEQLNNLIEKL